MGVTIGQVTQEDSSQENIPELEEIRTLLIPSSLIVHGSWFTLFTYARTHARLTVITLREAGWHMG